MKARDVPFLMLYGSLICTHRLQSDRPKCRGCLVDPRWTPKYDHKIPISWIIPMILISAGSPESPLSDEVWKHTQLKEQAKWQAEGWGTSSFHPTQALFCLLCCTLTFTPPHFGLLLCNALEYISSPSFPSLPPAQRENFCFFWNPSSMHFFTPDGGTY